MNTDAPEKPATAPSPPPPAKPRGLAEIYAPALPALDEMTEPDGALRAHWGPFVSMLDDLGRETVHARWDQARRMIRENGITHNVYDDPDGLARPWSLDLLPLPLPAAQWTPVSASLVQRARLFNALLADLYGPATVVTSGLLPPELVYANKGFLRPCHGVRPPLGHWTHLYAVDLVRGPDGEFRALSDRTQAPSGAGYSLENRIVLTRVLPAAFAQCNVLRLAPFFIALRQTLTALAPANRENPRVVLLTPGPYNETYFEHAYLARYLGYTLVQGADLTVRDGRVYLKTLSGLQRVDVILRRVDDDFCDPLELYAQSYLGVPGLLQAVRDGNVAVANALGSGVVEGPAFLPFLPRLCKHLLGEELKLQSVRTWWCGDAESRAHVLGNLSKLVIKPALPSLGSDPLFGAELSRGDVAALAEKIRARPGAFVAQEHVSSYLTPVYLNGDVQSRRYLVRAYLAASGDSYAVMPGGLTRVTGAADSMVVSLQKGGGSKDTWVMGDGPVSPVTLLTAANAPLALNRFGGDLPSRVADDLFWLGRYVQRAESVARLARCVFNRTADPNSVESPGAMQVLTRELAGRSAPAPGPNAARELAVAMFSAADPTALRSAARRFHGLARVLRDRISSDAWQIVQSIHRDVTDLGNTIGADDDPAAAAVELLNRLMTGFLAFGGMAAESMTRGQAWRFLDMGFRLERALAAARLVRATLVDVGPDEPHLLDAVLEVADSSLTYRRRYLTRVEAPAVLDLIFADETNPRAVAYQVRVLEDHLSSLPRETQHPQRNPDLQLAFGVRAELRLEDLSLACKVVEGRRPRLHALATETIGQIVSISELVARIFFTHAAVAPRPLGPGPEGPAT